MVVYLWYIHISKLDPWCLSKNSGRAALEKVVSQTSNNFFKFAHTRDLITDSKMPCLTCMGNVVLHCQTQPAGVEPRARLPWAIFVELFRCRKSDTSVWSRLIQHINNSSFSCPYVLTLSLAKRKNSNLFSSACGKQASQRYGGRINISADGQKTQKHVRNEYKCSSTIITHVCDILPII